MTNAGGVLTIKAKHSNLSLTAQADGKIVQATDTGAASQRWGRHDKLTEATMDTRSGWADAVNAKPVVIPALQQWSGGTGQLELTRKSRIVVAPEDASALTPVATQLQSDLVEVTGLRALDVVQTTSTRAGDIVIGLDPAAAVGPDTEVARAEGYTLDVDTRATIIARTAQGAFWATRSMLQILTGTSTHTTVPVGLTTDWPSYESRGFMLDVGRRYFTPEFLRDYTTYMSWYKLNTFQIHLNDNAITAPGGDWSKAQSAFRLNSDNPRFAGLAAGDGSYTRADWDSIEDNAAAHFVDIVPEIDAPAHSRAFIEFDPSLGLNGGNSDHLDLTEPATTRFMKDVFTEFTPWFRGETVHYGADEYPREYAAEYKQYFNDMAAHVRSLGKKAAAWGSFAAMSGNATGYDRDVTINSWNNGWYGPNAAIADGYDFINTNDGLLYIVPFAPYYQGRGLDGSWLFANWTPRHFGGSNTVPEGEDSLKGAMSAVWNDLVDADYTQQDVHGLVEPTFGILAQKLWRGTEPGQSHQSFMTHAGRLGMGPGMSVVTPTLHDPGDPRFAVSVSTPPVVAAGASAPVDVTVRNNHSTALSGPTATLTVADGLDLSVAPVGSGPRGLEPGQSGTWTFRITATSEATFASGQLTATVSGTVDRAGVTASGQATARTAAPAPAGSQHLSYGATASASSVEAGLARLGAPMVNDGDPATRWASNYTDNQWVQLQLASPSTVQSVELDWEPACAQSFAIDVSMDGSTWTRAATVDQSTCKTDTVQLADTGPVKFVRMQGLTRATTYGYSLYEFRVFGIPV